LAHWLRRANEEPGIFLGSGSFLVASELGSEELSCLLEFERFEKDGKLKFCRELPSVISGTRNFIQHNWSIGSTFILIFPGEVWESQIPENLFSLSTRNSLQPLIKIGHNRCSININGQWYVAISESGKSLGIDC
jgi:hypothetical protein